jgi:hypothetical protein
MIYGFLDGQKANAWLVVNPEEIVTNGFSDNHVK